MCPSSDDAERRVSSRVRTDVKKRGRMVSARNLLGVQRFNHCTFICKRIRRRERIYSGEIRIQDRKMSQVTRMSIGEKGEMYCRKENS